MAPITATDPWVLVLDIGSSSVRSSLFDATGRSLPPTPRMRRRYRWRTAPEGAMECEADFLVAEACAAIDAALEQVREEGLEVAAVAVAAFWHSLMGIDPQGSPVTPVYGWGDTRASPVALALRSRVDEQSLHARTGCFLHPSYPSVRLVWLRDRDSDAFARSASWVSFPEYLDWRLLAVRRCSTSIASGSGLLDVHRAIWDEGAQEMAGVGREQLFPLVDAREPADRLRPEYARRWPELSRIPWFPGLGDGACANAGSGAVGPDRPGITIGTSAAVRALWAPSTSVAIPDDLWCYRLDSRWWVAGGALSNGGNAVAFLRRTLLLGDSAETEALVAAMEADAHGLTILPFLRGERGPGWTVEREGTLLGLSDSTRPEEIVRAWMEAVAYRVARVERRLEGIVGPAREAVASGGALHASPAWSQILADTLDRRLSLATETEDTSRGAALVALQSLGVVSDLSQCAPSVGRSFEPDAAAHRRHDAAMRRQQELLDTLAPWLSRETGHDNDRHS